MPSSDRDRSGMNGSGTESKSGTPLTQPRSGPVRLKTEYENWFKQLQALTDRQLNIDDWPGRWYDGYTPAEALDDGPEDD